MIKIEETEVMNFNGATRGMRNPLESWSRRDSKYISNKFILGENDLKLSKTLSNAGGDHGKLLRQIFVCTDITAPLYWWKEYSTYKVGTVENSTSTMHKIHTKSFHEELFSMEDLTEEDFKVLQPVFNHLEKLRLDYNDGKDTSIWRRIIQMNFDSMNQKRTITLNYENLRNMYHARKNHKLTEWHEFCDWVKTLPYSEELIMSKRKSIDHDEMIIKKDEYNNLLADLEFYKKLLKQE